jgi:hypothetical protein
VKFLRRFFIRLWNLATGRSADQRIQEELDEHLAFQTEENVRAGMSPPEARRQAALRRSGKTTTQSKAFPLSRIYSSTCGMRCACF